MGVGGGCFLLKVSERRARYERMSERMDGKERKLLVSIKKKKFGGWKEE